jgi:hypothetical protein
VDATYRIQSASGSVSPAATSFTPALPSPTAGGTTLLLFIGSGSGGTNLTVPAVDPPWIQDVAASNVGYVLRRPDQPAGESSWPMSSVVGNRWVWRAEEWALLSTVAQPDAISNTAFHIGTTGDQVNTTAAVSPDVADYAALAVFQAHPNGTGGAWPAGRSYPAGWSEVDFLTSGTGAATGDVALAIAEAYPGIASPFTPTLTWDITGGGTYSDKLVEAWAAAYQPAMIQPVAEVMTS